MFFASLKMKTSGNLEKLVFYLRDHQPATIAKVIKDCMLNRRDASAAMQAGLQQGVIERFKVSEARPGERVLYRLTPHWTTRKRSVVRSQPSFDALLIAWGISSAACQRPYEGRSRIVVVE